MRVTRSHLRIIIREEIESSQDPLETILRWAEDGNRIEVAGKKVWPGLGNRSGLHSFADTLVRDKWGKSGERFTSKMEKLPAGTEVTLKRYQPTSRDRGKWVVSRTVTTHGPIAKKPAGEEPNRKRMNEILRELSRILGRDLTRRDVTSISEYKGDDSPWWGKVWEFRVGNNRMLFTDVSGPGEYAEQENDEWVTFSVF